MPGLQAATQVWIELSRGGLLGIEQPGVSRGAREGDLQEGVPPAAGDDEAVGWPSKDPRGRVGPDERHTPHGASL